MHMDGVDKSGKTWNEMWKELESRGKSWKDLKYAGKIWNMLEKTEKLECTAKSWNL